MTPEERFAAHEQWLHDHDKAIATHEQMAAKHDEDIAIIRAILTETTELQRRQSVVLLELTQQVTRLLDREDGRT